MAKSTTEQDMQAGDENAVVLEKDAADQGGAGAPSEAAPEPGTAEASASDGSAPARARGRRRTGGRAASGAAGTTAPRRGRGKGKGKDKDADKAAAPAERAVARTRVLPRVIGSLLVLAVLLGAVLVIQLVKGPGNGGKLVAQEDRSQDARQQANTMIPKLYSYDYRQIDANVNEQLQLTTGTINDQIRTQTGPALKQLAPKVKAVVQAVSLDSAVIDDSKPDIQVLVYLNQAVNSSLLPAPRLDRNRVVATMRLVNGQWKVADIKAL